MRGTREGRLWNEFIARYHYLGYKTLVGAQMRYAVHDRDGWPLAMLGFSTAAWKLAPRDAFIGWTPQLREKNLPLVVDNPRFLILPWIKIPNLGSHILAIVRQPFYWDDDLPGFGALQHHSPEPRRPDTLRQNTVDTYGDVIQFLDVQFRLPLFRFAFSQVRGRYDRDKRIRSKLQRRTGWHICRRSTGLEPHLSRCA